MSVPMRWETPVETAAPERAPAPLRRRRVRRARRLRALLGLMGSAAILALGAAGVRSLALGTRPAELRLLAAAPSSQQVRLGGAKVERRLGFVTVTGDVRNQSARSQSRVEAVVELLDSRNHTLQMESSLIAFDPLAAGESAPFRVELADDPHAVAYRVHFKRLMGPRLD
ncbi:MAG TPA: FxLYD domain-containing protein [Chthonomonadaceae bacterium]|nr:FxLYD domain-containing protein [Chthonomonadaceae bacterium]